MNNLKGLSVEEARHRLDERIILASTDPIVFIDRFCYTFDPKHDPYHLPFELFDFQKDLVSKIKEAIESGHDLFVEKCREMGVSYTTLDVFLWFWSYIPGSNFLLGSRKEDYVDSTGSAEISNKEESLFGKIEYTLRRLPPFMLPKGFDFRKDLTYMSLVNPENGNVISGESSNPNFSRGGRQKAILLDEFAFWDNDTAAWGATADTTNCRIVLTTPGIRPSKAKRLRFGKDGEKIEIITLPYNLDPRKTQQWLEEQRSRRSSEDFAREIMINWETSITGKVYPEISQHELGAFPYSPLESLYASWDFGLDGVAIQFWQFNKLKAKMRLIDCYTNDNKPIQFYFRFLGIEEFKDDAGVTRILKETFDYTDDDLLAIEAFKGFKKPIHFGDPDVSKRSLLTGTSTRQALNNVGIYVLTKPEDNDFNSRRNKTKVLLQAGIEVNQTPRTDYWLECMFNARYPQRLETSQATSAINEPIHDWSSHHRTATEYFAVNYEWIWENQPPKQKKTEDTVDTFDYHLKKMRERRLVNSLGP